jgi:hypothetical protein
MRLDPLCAPGCAPVRRHSPGAAVTHVGNTFVRWGNALVWIRPSCGPTYESRMRKATELPAEDEPTTEPFPPLARVARPVPAKPHTRGFAHRNGASGVGRGRSIPVAPRGDPRSGATNTPGASGLDLILRWQAKTTSQRRLTRRTHRRERRWVRQWPPADRYPSFPIASLTAAGLSYCSSGSCSRVERTRTSAPCSLASRTSSRFPAG